MFLYIWKRILIYLWEVKKKGASFHRIVLVGSDLETRRFARQIQNFPEMGNRIVGCLSDGVEDSDGLTDLPEVTGTIHQIEMVFREHPIDEVIVFPVRNMGDTLDLIAAICEDMGIQLTIVPRWPTLKIYEVSFRNLVGTPLLSFVFNPNNSWSVFFKRVLDFTLSLLVLLFFSPLFIFIALLIKWDSEGPVFFIQRRCGLNGRVFTLLKFRSMVKDAEKMQDQLKGLNEMGSPVFKITKDPRITRVGSWLRKTSLDELPQLINVLKGDISLVGPRSPLPSEVALYKRWQRRGLSVKPGITCIWQISG